MLPLLHLSSVASEDHPQYADKESKNWQQVDEAVNPAERISGEDFILTHDRE